MLNFKAGSIRKGLPPNFQPTAALKRQGIPVYRGRQGLTVTQVRGAEGELLKISIRNRLVGYATAGDELFFGLMRRGELVGLGKETKSSGEIIYEFSGDGSLKVVKKIEGLLPQGKFRVVWEEERGARQSIFIGNKIAALILEE